MLYPNMLITDALKQILVVYTLYYRNIYIYIYIYVYVCVCVFIKLHITAQSGLVILVILCHSH